MTMLPKLRDELSGAARRLDAAADPRRRTPRRRLRAGRSSLLAIVVALGAAGGLAYAATRTLIDHDRPFSDSQYRYGHCPRYVVALGPRALAEARRAAVTQARLAYPRRDLRGTASTGAQLVTQGSARSVDARRCGLLGRTVLVTLHLPAPSHSASLSEGAVYVSRIEPPGRPAYLQLWGLEH
ncbi:MAG TPA: hypothetical protein VHZ31_00925 [Solirubrobacteraceae bacterium]|nr:hypothetical protein [Solirubrobacteraceae bacterium]